MKKISIISLLPLFVFACKTNVIEPEQGASGSPVEKNIGLAKELVYEQDSLILLYMACNDTVDYIKSGEGFYYHITGTGENRGIKKGDRVMLEIELMDLNGELLYPKHSEEFVVDESGGAITSYHLIAKKLYGKGSTGVFLLPSFLAYGLRGDGDKVAPNQALVYKVRVL